VLEACIHILIDHRSYLSLIEQPSINLITAYLILSRSLQFIFMKVTRNCHLFLKKKFLDSIINCKIIYLYNFYFFKIFQYQKQPLMLIVYLQVHHLQLVVSKNNDDIIIRRFVSLVPIFFSLLSSTKKNTGEGMVSLVI
jgi:hypothetical protein